jgi:hypothetical protein
MTGDPQPVTQRPVDLQATVVSRGGVQASKKVFNQGTKAAPDWALPCDQGKAVVMLSNGRAISATRIEQQG